VPPGKTHTYTWQVPERAGPGPMDPSSIMWMYHSHVDEVRDTSSGLQGPIVVTRQGMARPDGSPTDVDREGVALFQVTNENDNEELLLRIAKQLAARQDVAGVFGRSLAVRVNTYIAVSNARGSA
jgi:hypothetical protein